MGSPASRAGCVLQRGWSQDNGFFGSSSKRPSRSHAGVNDITHCFFMCMCWFVSVSNLYSTQGQGRARRCVSRSFFFSALHLVLQELNLSHCQLTAEQLDLLGEGLAYNSSLLRLNLVRCPARLQACCFLSASHTTPVCVCDCEVVWACVTTVCLLVLLALLGDGTQSRNAISDRCGDALFNVFATQDQCALEVR